MGIKRAMIAAGAALALLLAGLVPSSGAQDGGEPPPPPLVGNTTVVSAGQFPAVGYLVADFPSGLSACTATLIASQWVLTAAHCVQAQDGSGADEHANAVTIYLNLVDANDIFMFPPPPDLETHEASGWIIHGDYNPTAIFDDVALVKLPTPSAVAPMDLATDTALVDAPNGSPLPATAFGFGINVCDVGNCPPADGLLRMGPTEISSDDDAETFLGGPLGTQVRNKNLFMLPNVAVHGGLCFGDSGGPLMVQQGGGMRIAGVNSFIIGNPGGTCNGTGGQYLNAVADVVDSNLASWVNQVIDAPSESCWGRTPTIEGTSFADKIIGTGVANVFHGRGADDLLLGRGARDRLCGGGSDDFINGGSAIDRIRGNNGNDILDGDTGGDKIRGGDGNDDIFGWTGGDDIRGEGGDDFIDGWTSSDTIKGGPGDDVIFGWTGGDNIEGNSGRDLIEGEDGDDILLGGSSRDTILGGDGDDNIRGGTAGDELRGNDGSDIIRGEDGNDDLFGGQLDDTLIGGPGDDDLFGQSGDDDLSGNSGADDLDGGSGTDSCSGGSGPDTKTNCE